MALAFTPPGVQAEFQRLWNTWVLPSKLKVQTAKVEANSRRVDAETRRVDAMIRESKRQERLLDERLAEFWRWQRWWDGVGGLGGAAVFGRATMGGGPVPNPPARRGPGEL